MPLFVDVARRAAAEVARRACAGLDLLATATTAGRDCQAAVAELTGRVRAQEDRIALLESLLAEQAAGLRAARGQVASLVAQLNEQLLPGIDERMHETERDLARLATRLVRADRETARNDSRLGATERRVGDLREKAARLEQRTGLWRELQANVARLGEDLDALRIRLAPHHAHEIVPPAPNTHKDLHR